MRVVSQNGPSRHGIATLWVILTIPVMLVAMCLAIEVARLWLIRQQLTTSLESAALAALHARDAGQGIGGTLPARDAAAAFAFANTTNGSPVELDLNFDPLQLPNQNFDCDGEIYLGALVERAGGSVFTTELQPGCGQAIGPNATARRLVSLAGWRTVSIPGRTYSSMVVVGTPNYENTQTPAVVRVRNVTSNSYEFMVQSVNDGTPIEGVPVHFLTVESGVYTLAADGVKMEAFTYTSTVTDRATNTWNGEVRAYSNTYTNPVVVGQVMSFNDPDWSVFWSRGNSRTNPANAVLRTGKHVAEDTDTTRAPETVGYIVIESGTGTMTGLAYQAALGPDVVLGMDNNPPFNYSLANSPGAYAVASQSGMDGNNGSWAVLYGDDPVSPTNLSLSVDEDQISNAERSHISENVGYIVLSAPYAVLVQKEIEVPFLCNFGCNAFSTTVQARVAAVFDCALRRPRLMHPDSVSCR